MSILTSSFDNPFIQESKAIIECATPTPIFLSTVESVRSLCHRDVGNFIARCSSMLFARPKLPSEFSKSIGLILCGIVDDPISPSTSFSLK